MDLLEEGIAHLREERYREAIECLQAVIESEPDNDRALYYLGEAYVQLDDHAAAQDRIRHMRRLVERTPDSAAGWYNLGVALRELSRFDEAVVALAKAVALDPAYAKAQAKLQQTECGKTSEEIPQQVRNITFLWAGFLGHFSWAIGNRVWSNWSS